MNEKKGNVIKKKSFIFY